MHTTGGNPTATESIVNYLRAKFDNDIRVIVPQLAMSAGTIIAYVGQEIIIGRQSSLGPIDPQFSGIPAYNVKLEFKEAKKILPKILKSDFCKSIGLKIKMMEDEQKLQDADLSLHHAYMISLDETGAVKIIKNQNGISRISFI